MPDVDDEGHGGLQRGNVGEVLFGPYSEVNASLLRGLQQFGNDVLERGFVRKQVIRAEKPVLLGGFFRQGPELLVSQFLRDSARRRSRGDNGANGEQEYECGFQKSMWCHGRNLTEKWG